MERFDRRGFLKIGSIAAFGYLPYGEVLRLQAAGPPTQQQKIAPKDISVIHLLLGGGLSHLDSFDLKVGGNVKYRGPFKAISTNIPGIRVCEHLPRTARNADKYLVIRSMTHKAA